MLRSALVTAVVVAVAAMIAGPLVESSMRARLLHHRLTAFYTEHAPGQLEKVESLVEKYSGKEEELLKKVESKYERKVPPVDVWALDDPIGVGAFVAYLHAKEHASALWAHLERRFPEALAVLDGLGARVRGYRAHVEKFVSRPAMLVLLALAYALACTRAVGVWRGVALLLLLLLALVGVHPTIDDLSAEALGEGALELAGAARSLWAASEMPVKLAVASATATLSAFTVLRHARGWTVLGVLAAALAITNPSHAAGEVPLEMVAKLGAADKSSLALFQHSEHALFAVHDLTLCSVLTLVPSVGGVAEAWAAPVLAVGAAERWFVLSKVVASKEDDDARVRIELPGLALPAFFGPAALALLMLVHALLSGL